ncbi:MAG TPA: polysaccharide deacetylase family protein [Polyangiales bacterium]|nr:polysaccharide deacetylase family protein [Polyangiales bacterium]
MAIKSQLFRAGLSALWYSGAARACERWVAGKGAILMLHRVRPERTQAFAPNARLSISPEYLSALLASFRRADVDVISLDEALLRLHSQKRTRRFVCFTFDDGYLDNLEHALPVFKRFHAPFTVYATTSFADRTLAPWWCALEDVVANESEVRWVETGAAAAGARVPQAVRFGAATLTEKQRTFAAISARFFALTSYQLGPQLRHFLADHGRSMSELAARDMCNWSDLRCLQAAGVEIGCHGVSHACLSRESLEMVHHELASARERLEAELGRAKHLAYPYGKREHVGARELATAKQLGFTSAVTNRRGVLFGAHIEHLHALPRVEVTQSFAPSPHYLHTILSGLPLAARNRGRLVVHD